MSNVICVRQDRHKAEASEHMPVVSEAVMRSTEHLFQNRQACLEAVLLCSKYEHMH